MSSGLAEVLVAQGVVDEAAVAQAVTLAGERGVPLGKVLVELGAASEGDIVGAVARQLGLPFADLAPGAVDPSAAALLPRSVARELMALPVEFGADGGLVVAIADPANRGAAERVSALTGMACTVALAVKGELMEAIEHLADPDGDAGGGATPAPGADTPKLAFEEAGLFDLAAALAELVESGGSDLHLTAGLPPTMRVNGELAPMGGYPVLTPTELQKAIYGILTQRQREQFENELELDLSHSVSGLARFRVNVFRQRDAIGAVIRVIPFGVKAFDQLGLPSQVANFAYLPRGFVLVTGPTGSGKSTTLASLIDIINRERACHIMTVEDPIEFLHEHKRSVVNQRELGADTRSFAQALKHVLRQDPDVILVGEMRDLETIQVALTAAETGHLVFGTLHTQDAPQTVDRVIDVFPPHQQEQIRVMLSGALQGVLTQQLLKTADGKGRVLAAEVMVATPAIRNLIREGKTHQMYSMLQSGKQHGMVTMDQSLADLVKAGKVRYEDALERCTSVPDFNRLCGRA
ncbi:MAG TPA: PilT/PilU family type 4a pilus ATPase [Egibacteraceae bacterium]|nr:PilT/PilU family type 4a pilus ATPase [Egibacteraceae bacterium]